MIVDNEWKIKDVSQLANEFDRLRGPHLCCDTQGGTSLTLIRWIVLQTRS